LQEKVFFEDSSYMIIILGVSSNLAQMGRLTEKNMILPLENSAQRTLEKEIRTSIVFINVRVFVI